MKSKFRQGGDAVLCKRKQTTPKSSLKRVTFTHKLEVNHVFRDLYSLDVRNKGSQLRLKKIRSLTAKK